MSYLGSWKIDDFLAFCCNTHDPDTGVATDADSVPTYRVYEDETATPILTGSTALLDDANTTGFYSDRIQLTAANGFEKGKCYTIYITATVGTDTGTMHHNFQLEAEVDANTVSASNVSANVEQIEGADPTDTIRDAVVDDATRIDASELNTLSGHDPGGTLCADGTPLTAAETESEVNDALVALHLDHLLAADYDPASQPGTATALLNELVESDGGVSRFTVNALEQGPNSTTGLALHSDYDAAKTAAPASEYDTEMGRITANVALASICTETRLAELDAANLPTDIADVPTVAEFNARTQPTADYFDPANDAVANVTAVATLTGHTAQTGDSYARLGAPAGASIAADLVAIDNFVDDLEARLTAARAGYLDELAAANIPADVDTLLTRITAAVALASVCTEARLAELAAANLPADIAALPSATDITQRQIPDSVPADGTRPTIEQALYMIVQFLHERAVVDTTVTVKKVDGSTSLLTLTLDDGTDPTSITRSG